MRLLRLFRKNEAAMDERAEKIEKAQADLEKELRQVKAYIELHKLRRRRSV